MIHQCFDTIEIGIGAVNISPIRIGLVDKHG